MTREQAIQVLRQHNEWRRYNGAIGQGPQPTDPKTLGIAIDTACDLLANLREAGTHSIYLSMGEKELTIFDDDLRGCRFGQSFEVFLKPIK